MPLTGLDKYSHDMNMTIVDSKSLLHAADNADRYEYDRQGRWSEKWSETRRSTIVTTCRACKDDWADQYQESPTLFDGINTTEVTNSYDQYIAINTAIVKY